MSGTKVELLLGRYPVGSVTSHIAHTITSVVRFWLILNPKPKARPSAAAIIPGMTVILTARLLYGAAHKLLARALQGVLDPRDAFPVVAALLHPLINMSSIPLAAALAGTSMSQLVASRGGWIRFSVAGLVSTVLSMSLKASLAALHPRRPKHDPTVGPDGAARSFITKALVYELFQELATMPLFYFRIGLMMDAEMGPDMDAAAAANSVEGQLESNPVAAFFPNAAQLVEVATRMLLWPPLLPMTLWGAAAESIQRRHSMNSLLWVTGTTALFHIVVRLCALRFEFRHIPQGPRVAPERHAHNGAEATSSS